MPSKSTKTSRKPWNSSRASKSAAPAEPPSPASAPQRVDLHTHSRYSDGEETPEDLARRVQAAGLAAASLTDHDCLDGFEEFQAAASGFLPIPGVEVSAREAEADVHILGFFVDPGDERLRGRLEGMARAREERMATMVERLRRAGVSIAVSDVEEHSSLGTVGRPHLAMALVERGAADSVDDAFRRWLRPRTPGYVPKPGPSPAEAISWIHEAGGVAVLAHPGIGRTLHWVEKYARAGLDGIEVWHPRHGESVRGACLILAERLGLVPTGGSDYHGPRVGDSQVGQEPVSTDVIERLRRRCPPR